jgi:hypothetical protein
MALQAWLGSMDSQPPARYCRTSSCSSYISLRSCPVLLLAQWHGDSSSRSKVRLVLAGGLHIPSHVISSSTSLPTFCLILTLCSLQVCFLVSLYTVLLSSLYLSLVYLPPASVFGRSCSAFYLFRDTLVRNFSYLIVRQDLTKYRHGQLRELTSDLSE